MISNEIIILYKKKDVDLLSKLNDFSKKKIIPLNPKIHNYLLEHYLNLNILELILNMDIKKKILDTTIKNLNNFKKNLIKEKNVNSSVVYHLSQYFYTISNSFLYLINIIPENSNFYIIKNNNWKLRSKSETLNIIIEELIKDIQYTSLMTKIYIL